MQSNDLDDLLLVPSCLRTLGGAGTALLGLSVLTLNAAAWALILALLMVFSPSAAHVILTSWPVHGVALAILAVFLLAPFATAVAGFTLIAMMLSISIFADALASAGRLMLSAARRIDHAAGIARASRRT